ncbi:MAG: ABC transporter permease [Candidatus Latescibacteria bacterium]|nr:ABC transporter permease [Candidatus Latescibacterota bacterium]
MGDVVVFLGKTIRTVPNIPKSLGLIFDSMLEIGVRSIPIALVISIFAGATTAWQANYQLQEYVSMRYLGTAVSKSLILELGPVLTGLVVAGRVGASIAASLGAMRVTEQIDALSTMAIDPIRYLVLPRVTAAMIMVPILTIYSVFFGIVGAMFVSMYFLGVTKGIFIVGVRHYFYYTDIMVCLIKAFIFGTGLSVLGCYYGFKTTGGAEGVGKAAIKAFVSSAIFILLSDFIVAALAF